MTTKRKLTALQKVMLSAVREYPGYNSYELSKRIFRFPSNAKIDEAKAALNHLSELGLAQRRQGLWYPGRAEASDA